ncbi:MAG: 50S ribosomal protein L25, partial [Candidatus Omnitrophica bacterium]|nr:50S ribosomal protein L25 [Candidatus Omnitrophota bacterium]
MEGIEVEVRKEKGTRAVKRLREKGYIPAILYGKEKESLPLILNGKDFQMVLHHLAGKSSLLELKIKKDDKIIKKRAILKEVQKDLTKDMILHLDFYETTLDKPIAVNVPVTLIGESPGVKEGGVLDHVLWEIKVETLPAHIPEKIEADISSLKIGDSLYVRDLKTEEITILNEPTDVVTSILAPRKEEEVAPPVEEEAAEPEVISEEEAEERRKKKEEEKPPEEAKELAEEPAKEKKPEKDRKPE